MTIATIIGTIEEALLVACALLVGVTVGADDGADDGVTVVTLIWTEEGGSVYSRVGGMVGDHVLPTFVGDVVRIVDVNAVVIVGERVG